VFVFGTGLPKKFRARIFVRIPVCRQIFLLPAFFAVLYHIGVITYHSLCGSCKGDGPSGGNPERRGQHFYGKKEMDDSSFIRADEIGIDDGDEEDAHFSADDGRLHSVGGGTRKICSRRYQREGTPMKRWCQKRAAGEGGNARRWRRNQ